MSMKPSTRAVVVFSIVTLAIVIAVGGRAVAAGPVADVAARLVAVGIPGVSAVSAVGMFHPGGPIHDKPAFRAHTQPGGILDPDRIFVAGGANFGAPLGTGDQPPGVVLSLDPRGPLLAIPPDFAAGGGQASALQGRVRVFTANSPAFLNRVYNPNAVTAEYVPVARPTAISINNAFGRPWLTSVPFGPKGAGIQTVLDPDGRPLDGAPNKMAGGVFTGTLTNRTPQLVPGGISTGAVATALLGKSPDGSGRAVFAGLNADGSVVQVHVELGVDGLAPVGTVDPLEDGARATRSGMVFNWVPNRILYIADPACNAIVALALGVDGKTFRVESKRVMAGPVFDVPVDLAPAVAEIANPAFASNTTLAGDADIYVANRGNGTVVRLKQDGSVVAIRRITVPGVGPLGGDRLNGIAVSPDATRVWLTVTGRLPGHPEGAVIEIPAFGASGGAPRG
jgi:hypothetical protein